MGLPKSLQNCVSCLSRGASDGLGGAGVGDEGSCRRNVPRWRGSHGSWGSLTRACFAPSTDRPSYFPLGVSTTGSSQVLKIIRWANKVCGLLQGQGRGEHCRKRRGILYKVWFGEDRAQSVSLLSSDPWADMATSPFLCHGLEAQAMCHSAGGGGCEPSSVAC